MYLSKCIINGFKSFADKTEIDFKNGLSAIVGPNGSGKSNIYEAILWVLGEQRAKSLRSNKMEDVIFAGSSARSEVGMAEVILVISDPECELMDMSEVQITRRLFRNGQSEYYINSKPCRLKDIAKILANTGIGRNSYAFIGQGKIEEILKARPHELRLLFEEAAGIAHYKEQKFTTQAQLSKTQDSITRIDDLIEELQVDVENLQVRAKKAIKHQDLTAQLSKVSKDLLIGEFNISKSKLEKIKEKLKELKYEFSTNEIEQDSLSNTLLLGETLVNELSDKKNELEKEIIRVENTVQNYKAKLADLSDYITELNEFVDEKQGLYDELKKSQINNVNQIEATKHDIKTLTYTLSTNKEFLTTYLNEVSMLEDKLSGLDISLLEDEKSKSEQQIGSLKQKEFDLQEKIDNKHVNIKNNSESISQLLEDISLKEEDLNKLNNTLSEANSSLSIFSNELEELRERLSINNSTLKKNYEILTELKDKRRNEISELTLLQKLQSEFTGYYAGVKSVLLAKKNNPDKYKDIIGVVAELIKVPNEFQTAISSVLGGQSQYLVSKTGRDATNAINMLKANRAGKATFLPLDRIQSRLNNIPDFIKSNPHFCGRAIDLIEFNHDAETAIRYLLNNVLIIDSVDAALQLTKNKVSQFLIVTVTGEVFSGKGLISGGRNKKDHNVDLIARNEKIEKLQKQLSSTNNSLKDLSDKSLKLKESYDQDNIKFQDLDKKIQDIKGSIRELEKQQFFTETMLSKLKESHSDKEKLVTVLRDEIDSLSKELEITISRIQNNSETLLSNYEELANARELLKNLNDKKSQISEVRSEIRLNENKIKHCEQSIISYEENKVTIDKQIDAASNELKLNTDKLMKLETEYSNLLNEFDEWDQKFFTQTETLREITSEYLKASELQVKNSEKLKSLQISKEQINRGLQRNDRRLIEQETIHKFVEAELYQASISKEECILEKPISNREVEDLKLRVNKLKKMINDLGEVDYGSIADLKRREERISFLNQQKEDLENSKLKLYEVIGEVDKICYDKLAETIDVVRGNFKGIYTELFQGGFADIYWDNDEDDIFSSGIILKVSPPGKKVQNMDQLSGGEKSLTAIALLMAFTKMKTSSFCIFDEVDAALDETNNIRLANYWQQISQSTQVLAVTHSRHTMVHADNLFGVTMQEKGVSKIISVTLD